MQAAPAAERIPVDPDGIVDLAALEAMLRADPRPALVSVMLANNETGIVQPAARIAAIAHENGALFHCDAVQAAGKIPVNAAGDRRRSDQPVGAQAWRPARGSALSSLIGGAEPNPLIRGGGQERGRRAGTENLPGIAGFAAAAEAAIAGLAEYERLRRLRDGLEAAALAAVPEALVVGRWAPRLPNTTALALPASRPRRRSSRSISTA